MSLEAVRGRIDSIRLKGLIPQLQRYETVAEQIRQQLRRYYNEYISTMSTEAMAIGFETAVFLTVLCRIYRPRRILDLGSGFSSLVFRLYAMHVDSAISIWSVDDNREWLETTHQFLSSNNLSSHNLVLWQTFTATQHESFDLVLHDLGRMPFRMKTFKDAVALVKDGGLLVLDDIHKHEYRSYAKRVLKELNLPSYSLQAFTEDRFGRYCLLVTI